jgi:hypothetical protein
MRSDLIWSASFYERTRVMPHATIRRAFDLSLANLKRERLRRLINPLTAQQAID